MSELERLDAEFRAYDILRGQALRQALVALDAHINDSPSDLSAHAARDALELVMAQSYRAFMPWPMSAELKARVASAQREIEGLAELEVLP